MLTVKVLGSGCASCRALERTATQALEMLLDEEPDLEATVEHISDFLEIERYAVLAMPALVVNERLVCSGRLPKKEEILNWYRAAIRSAVLPNINAPTSSR